MEMCFTPGAAVPAGTSIPVLANPRLAELRDPSEDWTGVTSTAERRKLQNRLNQRARPTTPKNVFKNNVSKLCELGNEETRQMLSMFAEEAYVDYINGKPCPGYLTTLVRVNVFHAMVRNAQALDFNAEWLTYEAISPFNKLGPGLGPSTTGPSCPENMRPTALQLAVEHHPWIDFFPHPQMRDNFLQIVADKGEDYIDEDDMCRDIVDVGAGAGVEEAALIVWGEPWDPRGWEATESFLRKWGWLLVGCTEMLEGTNYWREKRGLKRLKFN
ncbi:hypothetical protein K4K54_008213 [Colletotrichum sp. SAR 10_86]|nr:hypothetical protein KHU50_007028 [Colletotrichum sp. SAR 10_65]KAI8220920.1 hypothetical protein K4K54_008213 [Colletotrichum sp. SAR 10_86]KAI8221454.1 hypothetical protein K4K53_007444 [Colletotrichum sp. SAR 10_77]